LTTTSPYFDKLVKQTQRQGYFKFVYVGDEQTFPKASVCIILVDLVYLESAKICTGLKIVRGLKRLRTTALDQRLNLFIKTCLLFEMYITRGPKILTYNIV